MSQLNSIEQDVEAYEAATSMNAIGLTRKPEMGRVSEALEMISLSVPRPGPEGVAIRLSASSMHVDEIYAAQGTALGRFYGPKVVDQDHPYILGSSVSGVVVGLGSRVDHLHLGDDVIVIPDESPENASWADYRCVDRKWVMPKPQSFSHVEAAAITMAACVAWGAIGFSRAKAGDRCLVVGASGSIGIMIVQYLKSLGCTVTAVCSGKNADFVRERGADDVVDYTIQNFADVSEETHTKYDRVFDCIGGREIERDGFRVLKPSGVYETVVGPVQYIGERKLSWPQFLRVASYILWRMGITRLGGPKYTFGEKFPRLCIDAALTRAVTHGLRMPIERKIPFELDTVRDAVQLLESHRAKGRIVIDFDSSS